MDEEGIAFAGVEGQLAALESGEITSVGLVEIVLRRIERLNPLLNAFVTVLEGRARVEAELADRARAAGDRRPLLGLPIAVKDDTDVVGVVTGHGSAGYERVAEADSVMVRRLREAGAIVVGKTTLPEFGQWPFTESTVSGITRNPWDPARTPGGSSGGTAAAVAAGLVAAGTGSDGGGSIRIPAACCGVLGLKPQRGRVSSLPNADLWHGLGSLGVITRDVAGAALLYDVISGADPGEIQAAEPMSMSFREAAATTPGTLKVRVITRSSVPGVRMALEQLDALERISSSLHALGHTVIRDHQRLPIPTPALLPRMVAGVRDDLAAADTPSAVEPRTAAWARIGSVVRGPARAAGEAYARRAERRVDRLFEDCDVILTPTIAEVPRAAGSLSDAGLLSAAWRSMPSIAFTAIFNVTGHPAVSIPSGATSDGVPLGVQLAAPSHGEETIVQLCAQIEQVRPWGHRRPAIATTAAAPDA